jgi:Mg2+-importing ATPase
MIQQPSHFWNVPGADLLAQLESQQEGLSSEEARQRLINYGANRLKPQQKSGTAVLLLGQFKNPIVLMLIFAAGLSFFLQDQVDAGIILFIVLVSSLLGFWQERGAVQAVEKLLAMMDM